MQIIINVTQEERNGHQGVRTTYEAKGICTSLEKAKVDQIVAAVDTVLNDSSTKEFSSTHFSAPVLTGNPQIARTN